MSSRFDAFYTLSVTPCMQQQRLTMHAKGMDDYALQRCKCNLEDPAGIKGALRAITVACPSPNGGLLSD